MRSVLLLLFCGTLGTAAAQTKWIKQGQEFERAALWSNAMDSYIAALQRNQSNTPAIIGLTRSGQHVLDDSLLVFRRQVLLGDGAAALKSYAGAVRLQERLATHRVKVAIPEFDRTEAERLQQEHLRETQAAEAAQKAAWYAEGDRAFDDRRYDDADRSFQRLCQLDRNYRDACTRSAQALAAGFYAQGLDAHGKGLWCSAYDSFAKAEEKTAGFRDATQMMRECLAKGGRSLLVMPLNGDYSTNELTDWMHSHILSRLIARANPFLSVVDREQLDLLLEEHEFCMSGLVESACAVKAGEFKGADHVMIVNLKELQEVDGDLVRQVRNGYEWYTTTKDVITGYVNGPYGAAPVYGKQETDHKDPVTYEEYDQEREVSIRLDYKVINVSTSTVMLSGTQVARASDKVHYITYSGTQRFLHAAGINGAIIRDRSEVRDLLDNKHGIRSMDALRTDVYDQIANTIARETSQRIASLCH